MDDQDLAERLLDQAESPYHFGKCPGSTHAGEVANPSCGDWVCLELRVSAEQIIEAWFQSRGCLISRAAASMLAEAIEGKSVADIKGWSPLKMLNVFGAPLTARRQVCSLLGFYALRRALGLGGDVREAAEQAAEAPLLRT